MYDLFQWLGAVTYCVILGIFLRKFLSPVRILLLCLSSLILVSPIARGISYFANQPEGQSYYGALLAQIVGIYFYLKISKASTIIKAQVWRSFGMASGLLYMFLRFGCFLRGCCWGRLCPFPWAHYYRNPHVVTPWLHLPLHPVQIYSALHGLIIFGIIYGLSRSSKIRSGDFYLGCFLSLMGLGRLMTDYFRADLKFHKQEWWGLSPNTWMSCVVLVIGLVSLKISYDKDLKL